jgi:hypothetical protein
MTMVPTSTGIGAPGTAPAPASLARSSMASTPAQASPSAVPFTRGSSLATMQDFSGTYAPNSTNQISLQTNAFLEYLVLDVALTTSGNSASVTFAADGPWNVFSSISLNDPANQAIITPITGYGAFLMAKYLTDTGCFWDPQLDGGYLATTGTVATGGSFSFRLVIPVEHRKRDALGAVNNSAANQRYLFNFNIISAFSGIYGTAPTTEASTVSVSCTQAYWTSPPSQITTSAGTTAVQPTPSGLGTVGFIRYERHNEVSGGGAPQIQLNNVGDYLSGIIFVLRNSSNAREVTDWPSPFNWWVNDFQVFALTLNYWQHELGRFYQYKAATGSAGGLDTGVFPLHQLVSLFDEAANFGPANQYLPTDATTKLQIRGSTWGASASYLEVYTRAIRPSSGAALFA